MFYRRVFGLLAAIIVAAFAGTPRSNGSGWIDGTATRASAARFLSSVVREVAANDYARAWQSLYPPHQLVAPLDIYVACELKSPVPGRLARLNLIRSWWQRVTPPGALASRHAVKVAFALRIRDAALGTSVDLHATFTAIRVGARWAWMLPAARYELYATHSC